MINCMYGYTCIHKTVQTYAVYDHAVIRNSKLSNARFYRLTVLWCWNFTFLFDAVTQPCASVCVCVCVHTCMHMHRHSQPGLLVSHWQMFSWSTCTLSQMRCERMKYFIFRLLFWLVRGLVVDLLFLEEKSMFVRHFCPLFLTSCLTSLSVCDL